MAMRDPSLVASKADIGQQAIKGGEAPQADIGHVCKLEESDLVGRDRRSTLGRMQLPGFLGVTKTAADEY
jgi:hypothetical protein